MFPEIHRDQRSSIDSPPPSFTSMAIMVSDSDPEEGAQCNPSKLWTFGLSILPSYTEPLKLPQKITTLSAPAAWKIFRLSECARTPYHSSGSINSGAFIIAYKFQMRVDIARIFLSTWGLVQTTISRFPMVAEMDTDVTNATALVQQNAFVRVCLSNED